MKSIINQNIYDHTKQPLFFGEDLNVQRYDKFRYKQLFGFYKKQEAFFWRPEEVSLLKDRSDFQQLTEHQKFIFTKNLGYQILLDSVQSRGIPHLLEYCSNNEFELFASIWQYFETIHSRSYSYVIDNVYSDPTKMHDSIMQDQEILKRASSVTKYYDDMIENGIPDSEKGKRVKLLLTLASINILEGIRFYVSFACSFAFAEKGLMEGNAKIISLINRDENLHLGFTQNVLSILRDNESEGFVEIYDEYTDVIREMYHDSAKEEMRWAEYLFENGSLMGLNKEILYDYIKYLTNKRMKAIKLEPVFDKMDNPISWIDGWTRSKSVQTAPQETENTSYVNATNKNIDDDLDFDFE